MIKMTPTAVLVLMFVRAVFNVCVQIQLCNIFVELQLSKV